MRMGTEVVLSIRNVGLKSDSVIEGLHHVHAPLAQGLKELIEFLRHAPLNRRFDICIGRDEQENTNRLMLEGRSAKTEADRSDAFDALSAELDSMIGDI